MRPFVNVELHRMILNVDSDIKVRQHFSCRHKRTATKRERWGREEEEEGKMKYNV